MKTKFTNRLLFNLTLCFLACVAWSTSFANNLVVSGGTRNLPYTANTVTFSIAWDNSWNVSGLPGNHDAIWVFMKYRECGQSGAWNHALLSTTMANHTLGASLAFAKPILTTDKWGGAGANNTGALVRRATSGVGSSSGSITLNIVGSSSGVVLNPLLEYDISIYGIEMVQVKQGTNSVGDGYSYFSGFYGLPLASNLPMQITTEAGIQTAVTYVGNYAVPVPAQFPKGVDEFYCMKYEISQGQYADFLNNIGAQASLRFYTGTLTNMFNMTSVSGVYTGNSGGPFGDCTDRACNYLSAADIMSYLDWSALRPMTEFEYEKACRGEAGSTPSEYAWGSGGASLIECLNVTGAGSGIETCTNLNANCHFSGTVSNIIGAGGSGFGTGVYGPVGCGIFARDATQTRTTTGATYWGIMEMSGNVWEFTIQPDLNQVAVSTASAYTGLWGDGQLAGASYDVTNWPTTGNFCLRGGSFATAGGVGSSLCISNRSAGRNQTNYIIRNSDWGGRGVR